MPIWPCGKGAVTTVLLDTHVIAWGLYEFNRLSSRARLIISDSDVRLISPISFYEIAQKVGLGKWPQMAPFIEQLPALAVEQGEQIAALDATISLKAGLLEWSHRDPFDRIIAATAQHYSVPLISADSVFDGVVKRLW